MPILQGDIRLVASQVMADVSNGGGAPTDTLIIDGESNGIFPDISETDRAGGRLKARKVFVQVNTANTDNYLGANVIVEKPPADPLVGVTVFSTASTFDRRTDAINRIESYLSIGPALAPYLLGDHIEGQMTLTLLGQLNVQVPVVSQTLVLRKLPGQAGQHDQYVRVTTVSTLVRTFTDASGDFQRLQINLGLSDQLDVDYPGFDASRYDTGLNFTTRTRLFDTVVADAARYYSASPLVEAATVGAYSVQAESIFTALVPSAQVETPIADARMNQQTQLPVDAGGMVTQTLALVFTTTQNLFIGGSIGPSSLSIVRGGITLKDKGGNLINDATGDVVGQVDYGNGVVSLLTNVFGGTGGAHTVAYKPAGTPTLVSSSLGIPVTVEGQRLTYVVTLNPVPVRGSTQVSYLAQGRWYVLQDDGSGALRGGDSAFGVGSMNFSTGTLSLTLGALPDVGSQVIVVWTPTAVAPSVTTQPDNGKPLAEKAFFAFEMASAIKPGTLVLTWNDGSARTSSDDSNGGMSGYAVGEVDYSAGIVRFAPSTLPGPATVLNVAITEAVAVGGHDAAFTDGGANWGFSLGGTVRAYTVDVAVTGERAVREYPGDDTTTPSVFRVRDDGAGNLYMATPGGNLTVGVVNYGSGACSINKAIASFQEVQGTWASLAPQDPGTQYIVYTGNQTRTVALTILNGPGGTVPPAPPWAWWAGQLTDATQWRASGSDGSVSNSTVSLTTLYVRRPLSSYFMGSDKYQLADSNVVLNPSPVTGLGTPAGTHVLFYSSLVGNSLWNPANIYSSQGPVNSFHALSLWTGGYAPAITNAAGVIAPALDTGTTMLVDAAIFRSAIAPLRSGSFSVAGTWLDGSTFTATADADGNLSTGSAPANSTSFGTRGVFGKVNYQTGVVVLRFGARAGADLGGLVGVTDWSYLDLAGVGIARSTGIRADSLRYNASAYTYIPLDPDIVGVNPVRLPSDGRVPIFRAGSYAVVGHTGTVAAATYANGATINTGRPRLSRIRVIDSAGLTINTGYTADLDAGTLHVDDITGWAQPVTVEHRIEDMALVRDAQINGLITFTRPLTHDYPEGAYVSSALVAGDLAARVSVLFDQVSWTNVWSDVLIGDAANATYNDIANPIEVSNAGTLTERWYIQFTNTTAFNVVGEHVGVIANGNTSTDCAPLNPETGEPYFTIRAAGWGLGWSTGNILRINTVGAEFPVWVILTVQQGPESGISDSFTLLVRGDVDRP